MKLYCPECKTIFEEDLELCPNDESRLFTLETDIEDPLVGATIDSRFKIEDLLGRGGMGAVYRGVQLSVGRHVAVKVLHNELIDREVALERFYRESKIISGLSHPNIVRLIDFGQDRERDLLYLVMELVDGFNLGDILERGRMRVSLALEIVYQVCGALTEPHALDVIHRDLKPDNLLIVPISDGTIQVKVLDFGIARALETNTQLTATGMVCGTPQYMAPEQAQNSELGPPTDLYALGVMLYEMLCGVPPFTGQNSLQVMLQQIQTAPKPLRNYLPPSMLPDEVEDLVQDMLAKGVEGRPQTARVVRDRIDQIRRLYNLEPVRIDPDVPRDEMFDPFVLDALPGTNGERGETAALRRETGLQRRASSTHETDERRELEQAHTSDFGGLTRPVSDAGRVEIMADSRPASAHGQYAGASGSGHFSSAPAGTPPSNDWGAAPVASHGATDSYMSMDVQPSSRQEHTTDTRPGVTSESRNNGLLAVLGVVMLGIMLAGGVALALVVSNAGGDDTDPDTIAAIDEDPIANPPEEKTPAKTTPEIKVVETTPKVAPEDPPEVKDDTKEPEEKKAVAAKPEEKKAVVEKKVEKETSKKKPADKPEEKKAVAEKKDDKPVVEKKPEEKPEVKKVALPDNVTKTPEIKKKPEIKKEEKKKLGDLFGGSKKPRDDDKKKLENYFDKK